MSSAEPTVTVLLAAPCEARDALRAALEGSRQSLIEVDPLTADAESVLKHSPKNVVVLLDGNTEDALDKFDSVLANPSIRLLFEEASVVTSRQGWDSARWSRHLAAKLVGSEDFLPEGVGDDQGFVAPKPRDAVRKTGSSEAGAGEDGDPQRARAEDAQPVVFDLESVEAFESVPDPEIEVAPASEPETAPASWEMFQAYDVGDTWKPNDNATPSTHQDLDALIASAAASEELPPVPVKPQTAQQAEPQDDEPAPASEFNFQTGLSPAGLQSDDALEAPPQPNDLPFENPSLRATDVTAALDAPSSPTNWSLSDDDTPEAPVVATPSIAPAEFNVPASRFATLSLLDDGTDGLESEIDAPSEAVDTVREVSRDGAVFLIGGAGGPDPLRTVLGALPAAFPRPLFIMQHLDAGNYDRLARQMERASNMRVELAEVGASIQRGTAYVVSPGITARRTADGYRFEADTGKRGFADFSDQFPGSDSAIVFLSGADVDWSDTGARFSARGAWLAAQAESGCFDFAVPSIMITRGAEALDALAIAQKLSARWNTEEQR